MATFYYQAKRTPASTENGEIEAVSKDQAVQRLSRQGLTPVSVQPADKAGARPDLHARQTAAEAGHSTDQNPAQIRCRTKAVDQFTRQLATLIKANVPILQALSLIAEQPGRRPYHAMVQQLTDSVRQGSTLSDAMARFPLVFNNLYLSMVIAGERGGVLEESLLRLAEHRERQQETRRRIQAALAYPAFVVVVGLATVLTVLTAFLPRVVGLFKNMEQRLPVPTQILIGVTDFLHANWYWVLIAAGLLAAILFRHRPGSRKKMIFDYLTLHTPVINRLIRNAEIAKFARTLALLIRNGISVHESLRLATRTLDNEALKNQIEQVGDQIVSKGATLSGSLTRAGVFPRFALNMIRVGEESGDLEEALNEVAGAYDREVEQSVKLMMSLLEPILILLVGGIVAFIVFAMLLPIFDIGGF